MHASLIGLQQVLVKLVEHGLGEVGGIVGEYGEAPKGYVGVAFV